MSTAATRHSRCDSTGRAFAGSQRQIQLYVNERSDLLQQAITQALQRRVKLRWVSPLASDKYREYRDGAFLNAFGLSRHRKELSRFWPKGGPVWDALATEEQARGVVLIEAKSHLPEIFGNGCCAVAERSVKKINSSLFATKTWLEISEPTDWNGALYQSANRIAHLYFFREILHIPAWLVNVYFTEDPHSPTSRAEWEFGMRSVKEQLGIAKVNGTCELFLPAIP